MDMRSGPFFETFSSIPDPRKDINKKHLLIDMLFITLCAVITGVKSWEEIADYAKDRKEWLQKYLELPNGIPSHDAIRYLFLFLDPKKFNQAFVRWVEIIMPVLQEKHIAIDGKTSRRSGNKKKKKAARSHWGIETSLHWTLDTSFDEDQCRKRMKNSAKNISTIRKIALNILKTDTSFKASINRKMLKAGRNTDFLEKLLQL